MFSWTSLTRFQLSFHRLPSIRPLIGARGLFSQSQPSTLSSSTSTSTGASVGGFRDADKTNFDKFLTSVSGLAVVGSALGFWYFSNSLGEDPVQAFASYARDENQLQQQYEPQKKNLPLQ